MGVHNKLEKSYIKDQRILIEVIENKCWMWAKVRWWVLWVGRVGRGWCRVGNGNWLTLLNYELGNIFIKIIEIKRGFWK